ncbi:MAG: DMT family transporter [Clostridia bacterium]|nr:DMT family transporter [Clostridia bacterium]
MSETEKEKLTPEKFFSKGWVVCVGAIICCLLWGSAFPCVKIGYNLFGIDSSSWSSLLLFAGMRFALAGVMVICVYSIIRRRFVYPKAKNLWRVGVLSVFQTVAQYIFFYIGLSNISGVKSSVLNGLGVFFTILAACFLFRTEKFNLVKLAGCILGFGGVILINLGGEFTFDFTLTGEGFIIFSGLAGAIAAGFVKIFSKKEDPAVLSGYQFLLGGIILMVIGGAAGGTLGTVSVGAVFMLIYLAFISACAFTLQGFLIMYNPVSKVAVYKSTNPLFGALFSAIILGESEQLLSPMTLVALLLVCAGIFIINKYGEKRKKIPGTEEEHNPADEPYGMYDPAYMEQGGAYPTSEDPPDTPPMEADSPPPDPPENVQEQAHTEPADSLQNDTTDIADGQKKTD